MSPRLLHVLNTLRPSGAEVMLKQAAHHWRRAGFDLAILACGSTVGPFGASLAEAGYHIEHLPFCKSVRGMTNLCKALEHLNPGLIHLHSEGMAFFAALANKITLRRPAFRTVHSSFQFSGLLRQRKLLERALQRAWGVQHIAIGPGVAENEQRRFRNPSILLPNWFDAVHFRPPTPPEANQARIHWNLPHDQPVLISVGNCSETKNHRALIKALAHPVLRDRPWIYLHAGHEEHGAPERALANSLGISQKVRFLGPVQDVRNLLWAADLFTMPSLFEGFSIAALEAAGTGIPMLLSQAPGLRDLNAYDHPSTIAWADLYDPEALVYKLVRCLEGPLAHRPRMWVKEFDINCGAARYLQCYLSAKLP